jgi:hypothetical protein
MSQDIVPITNVHNMRTHGKATFCQLVDRLNLNTAVLSPVPTFIHTALSDSAWRSAMQAEFNALRANDT